MGLFIQVDGIEGESTDSNHQKWILADSASLPVFRSIPSGAVDQQRTKGETQLGDISVVRQLDKSSPKLFEAVALGKFNKKVTLEFTTQTGGKNGSPKRSTAADRFRKSRSETRRLPRPSRPAPARQEPLPPCG